MNWVNDNWCDCGDCEDEYGTEWNCSNCECTDDCTTYTYCPGYSYGTTLGPVTTEDTATTGSATFECDDGCEIPGFVFFLNISLPCVDSTEKKRNITDHKHQ